MGLDRQGAAELVERLRKDHADVTFGGRDFPLAVPCRVIRHEAADLIEAQQRTIAALQARVEELEGHDHRQGRRNCTICAARFAEQRTGGADGS